jgi:hypothetical protein
MGERLVKIDIVISGSSPSETVGVNGQWPPAPSAGFESDGLGAKSA